MSSKSRQCVIDLLPQQILRLREHAGTTLICDSGRVWVTQEGELRDDFLSAGESLCIVSPGLILAQVTVGGAARLTLRVAAHSRMFPVFSSEAAI
jgi:hypothetical protein